MSAGYLRRYTSRLVVFEHTPPSSSVAVSSEDHPSTSSAPQKDHDHPLQNILLFIPGLGDGLGTVPYITHLVSHLPPNWTLAEILLSSGYTGWGISSLEQDVKEINECVEFYRGHSSSPTSTATTKRKIILMGHSTGCQDIFSYLLTSPSDPDHAIIEGAILQAPVSDRESMIIQPTFSQESYDTSVTYAKEFLSRGQDQEIIPRSILSWFTTVPCTPQRFLSLASPDKNGAEDFFSSDLEDEKLRGTFGRLLSVRVPVCILYSGEDEHVPKFVDKEGLLRRWMRIAMEDGAEQAGIIDEAHSAVISGANHTLDGCTEGVLQDVIRRVVGFVKMCETIKDLNDGLQCSLS